MISTIGENHMARSDEWICCREAGGGGAWRKIYATAEALLLLSASMSWIRNHETGAVSFQTIYREGGALRACVDRDCDFRLL